MKGFRGFPGGVGDLMRKAQEMQAKIEKVKGEIAVLEREGSAGGGAVRIIAKGDHTLALVKIDPAVLEGKDATMLEDLVLTAANDALKKIADEVAQRMESVTGGIGIPGM